MKSRIPSEDRTLLDDLFYKLDNGDRLADAEITSILSRYCLRNFDTLPYALRLLEYMAKKNAFVLYE